VTNPFEDESRPYVALINDEDQYSLWPASFEIPAGWKVVLSSSSRSACLAFIEEHWVDMRPRSLIVAMGEDGEQ